MDADPKKMRAALDALQEAIDRGGRMATLIDPKGGYLDINLTSEQADALLAVGIKPGPQ